MEEKAPSSRNDEQLSFKPILRFFRNAFLAVLALIVFVFIGSAFYQAEKKEALEKEQAATVTPIWYLQKYKDPMSDLSFTRMELFADQTTNLGSLLPTLVLECAPARNGNKFLSVSIRASRMLTPKEDPDLVVRFGDDPQTHWMQFSAFDGGKSLSPRDDEVQFILSLLSSDRLRVQIMSSFGETPFISFRMTPQDKAREYVKECWGDYAALPASVSPNVAALVWGMNVEWVTAYQHAMKAVGLYEGAEDGIANSALFGALQKYAVQNHLREVEPDKDKAILRPDIMDEMRKDKRISEDVRKMFGG